MASALQIREFCAALIAVNLIVQISFPDSVYAESRYADFFGVNIASVHKERHAPQSQNIVQNRFLAVFEASGQVCARTWGRW